MQASNSENKRWAIWGISATILATIIGVMFPFFYSPKHPDIGLPVQKHPDTGSYSKVTKVPEILKVEPYIQENQRVKNKKKPTKNVMQAETHTEKFIDIEQRNNPLSGFKSKLISKNQPVSSCFCGEDIPNSIHNNVLRLTIDEPECDSQEAMIVECERSDLDARRCEDEDGNDDGYAHKLICT